MLDTATYQLPYPEPTDPPDGAAQIKALAEAVDTLLKPEGWSGTHPSFTGNITVNRFGVLVVCGVQLTHNSPPWTAPNNYPLLAAGSIPATMRPNTQVQTVCAVNYETTQESNGIITVAPDGGMIIGPQGAKVTVVRASLAWRVA